MRNTGDLHSLVLLGAARGVLSCPEPCGQVPSALVSEELDHLTALRAAMTAGVDVRSRPGPGDPDRVDDGLGLGAVVAGADREGEGQRSSPSVAGEVDLAGQPAAGASESSFLEPPLTAVC
ncbi:hypothetical protein GCM10023086_76590 [Streptomyces venetus]|uniref:Uncharacterized protein n=1 Tax=Streptomyces venetus TaxID=1701086 RepID=A0ABP8HLH0_9ACTN